MAQLIKGKQIKEQTISISGSTGNVIAKGDLDMLGYDVILSNSPVDNNHAANKAYVDSLANGLRPHAPVRVMSTSTIGTLSGTTTIDGVSIVDGDRVLLSNQGGTGTSDSHVDNGVWEVVSGGTWVRPTDMDGTPEQEVALGDFVFVEEGTVNSKSGWVLSGTDANDDGNIDPNTEAQVWVKIAAPGSYSADGQGIELSGSQFSLELDGGTLSKSASGVKVSDSVMTRISSNETDITSLDSALTTETSSRISADSSLDTALTNEESSRIAADSSLDTALTNEESSRIAADSSLETSISGNTSDISSLDTALTNEESSRIAADSSLETSLSGETSSRISADSSLETSLSGETSSRISADSSLESLISSSNTDLTSLETALSNEESSRIAADSSLETSISGNTSDISSLDTALTNEESSRIAADSSLETSLSGETSSRISADSSLETSLSGETSSRISADSSLETAISNISDPELFEMNFTPSNSGSSTAVEIHSTAFNHAVTNGTVSESSIIVFLNGLAYQFEYAQGTAVFHTNGTTPDGNGTTLYFDGTAAGFTIETDDTVKIKYTVTV